MPFNMKKPLLKHVVYMAGLFTTTFTFQCLTMAFLLARNDDIVFITNEIDVVIQGTVTDIYGEPIPGVTISVQGTSTGTATDIDGKYSLTVPDGAALVFSFIGYETQVFESRGRSIINVVLQEDMSSL